MASRQIAQQNANTYARMNYQQLKEQEQINKERVRQEEFATEQKRKLIEQQKSQYRHVQSHGYGSSQAPSSGRPTKTAANEPSDVEIKVFIRECDNDGVSFSISESQALENSPGRVQDAGGLPPSNSTSGPPNTAKLGKIPQYLTKRKAEMEAEKAAIRDEVHRQQELAKYPPGHRPVTEEERGAILSRLAARKRELEVELGKLPMRFDTQALRVKKNAIETEMAEVEAAERKFSVKKQLFVPI